MFHQPKEGDPHDQPVNYHCQENNVHHSANNHLSMTVVDTRKMMVVTSDLAGSRGSPLNAPTESLIVPESELSPNWAESESPPLATFSPEYSAAGPSMNPFQPNLFDAAFEHNQQPHSQTVEIINNPFEDGLLEGVEGHLIDGELIVQQEADVYQRVVSIGEVVANRGEVVALLKTQL